MKKGYYLIESGLTQPGLLSSRDASVNLSHDDQVRCLSYIATRMGEISSVPQGIYFEIIPLRYHHFGEPYPCIGMYAEGWADNAESLTTLSFRLGKEVATYISKVGIVQLLGVASGETLTWQDILQAHQMESVQPTVQ